jgi:hypothetical protein
MHRRQSVAAQNPVWNEYRITCGIPCRRGILGGEYRASNAQCVWEGGVCARECGRAGWRICACVCVRACACMYAPRGDVPFPPLSRVCARYGIGETAPPSHRPTRAPCIRRRRITSKVTVERSRTEQSEGQSANRIHSPRESSSLKRTAVWAVKCARKQAHARHALVHAGACVRTRALAWVGACACVPASPCGLCNEAGARQCRGRRSCHPACAAEMALRPRSRPLRQEPGAAVRGGGGRGGGGALERIAWRSDVGGRWRDARPKRTERTDCRRIAPF